MKMQVIVIQANHYDMEDNKGLSVRIVGDYEETNNKFGLSVTDATVKNYEEVRLLKHHKKDLPAAFNATMSIVTKKASNGKDMPSVALSNLEFVHALQFAEKKPSAAAK
ncbi:hypothetical protein ACFTQ7_24610 [Lysinibacillus sp. NPDC056959]|uniref:hypothetical protein n=1 Tax=Lysinibacillus sp. NPDC056959 TaxID=3345981 RepID=UPI00363F52F2